MNFSLFLAAARRQDRISRKAAFPSVEVNDVGTPRALGSPGVYWPEKLLNGATNGATPETQPYRARMAAGSEAEWEVMIEHVNRPRPGRRNDLKKQTQIVDSIWVSVS